MTTPSLIQKQQLSVTGKCVHFLLGNCFGGLRLPRRNSVVRLPDCPHMIIAVYCGHKATKQQQREQLL